MQPHSDVTIDFEQRNSPEILAMGADSKASRKNTKLDVNNIKKTQSMKRMMLESQEVELSPQTQAVMQMHNSIALLN